MIYKDNQMNVFCFTFKFILRNVGDLILCPLAPDEIMYGGAAEVFLHNWKLAYSPYDLYSVIPT